MGKGTVRGGSGLEVGSYFVANWIFAGHQCSLNEKGEGFFVRRGGAVST